MSKISEKEALTKRVMPANNPVRSMTPPEKANQEESDWNRRRHTLFATSA